MGGGKNLITDYTYDEQGRQIQTLGPEHLVEVDGEATMVRRASWNVYKETCSDLDETWTAQGYAADYPSLIKSDNPAGYWRLNEATGITAADQIDGHDGTYSPNSAGAWTGGTLDQPGALIEGEDTSALFNGSNGNVQVPHSSALQPTSVISVECWFKTSSTAFQRFVGKVGDPSAFPGYTLNIGHTAVGAGKVHFSVGGGQTCASTATYHDGNWHHAVGTYDGTTARLYMDGVLVKSIAQTANLANTSILTIGGTNSNNYMNGNTADDSALSSNLLLRAIEYPTDTSTSRVEMKYNRAGQVVERKDQADTIHAYDYDRLGRQTQDRVIDTGPDIDETVLRIATAYEVRGMVKTITSYDDATFGEGDILNQVLFDYNDFGQLISDFQSHEDAVNTGTTPKVQYTYEDAGNDSNIIRPTSLIYPDGRIVTYNYGTAGGMNDKLNRVESLDE